MGFELSNRSEWILAQANDWLRFAEAKNGALVVFDSAILLATMQLASEHAAGHILLKLYLASLGGLLGTSLAIALFSFLPRTTIPLLSAGERPSPRDNLIFFGAAKKYTAQDYAAEISTRYGLGEPTDAQWEQDVAEQVVTNARIAMWKYTCFKVALWGAILAILTPVLGPVVFGLLYAWSKSHRI